MDIPHNLRASSFLQDAESEILEECGACGDSRRLGFQFSYAFQPIVDVLDQTIFAHEALVRGAEGEPASTILEQVTEENRYRFDQACRVKAIKTAAELEMRSKLSINFLPNAIYKPEVCIRTTLASASKFDFAVDRIIFETVEGERINDAVWLAEIFKEYRRQGFKTAIDDFGAGFAGLALLADFQPDIIKLDMALVRGIDANWPRQSIVRGILSICRDLNIDVIAEGVETDLECKCLQDLGVRLMQGYLFSKPIFKGCVLDSTTLAWPTRP